MVDCRDVVAFLVDSPVVIVHIPVAASLAVASVSDQAEGAAGIRPLSCLPDPQCRKRPPRSSPSRRAGEQLGERLLAWYTLRRPSRRSKRRQIGARQKFAINRFTLRDGRHFKSRIIIRTHS